MNITTKDPNIYLKSWPKLYGQWVFDLCPFHSCSLSLKCSGTFLSCSHMFLWEQRSIDSETCNANFPLQDLVTLQRKCSCSGVVNESSNNAWIKVYIHLMKDAFTLSEQADLKTPVVVQLNLLPFHSCLPKNIWLTNLLNIILLTHWHSCLLVTFLKIVRKVFCRLHVA